MKDRTPVTTKRVSELLGIAQEYVYRLAQKPETKLRRVVVDGGAILFERWSVDAESERLSLDAKQECLAEVKVR